MNNGKTKPAKIKTILITLVMLAVSGCASTNKLYYIGVEEKETPQTMTSIKFAEVLDVTQIDDKAFVPTPVGSNSALHQVFLAPGIHKFKFKYNSGVSKTVQNIVLARNLEAGKNYAITMTAPTSTGSGTDSRLQMSFRIEEISKP